MEIIKDKSGLNKYVTETVKQYASVGTRVHVAFVSALFHAASTGYVETLNRLFAGLRSNDQTALKMFVRRANAIIGLEGEDPDGLPSETIQAAIENGAVLDFKKGEFFIKEGRGHTSKQAKALVSLCTERFIKPDGERDKMVLDRNNFSEVKTLGDADVLKQVLRALKLPESTGTKREIHVSDKVNTKLSKMRDEIEVMLSQTELSDTEVAKAKAA